MPLTKVSAPIDAGEWLFNAIMDLPFTLKSAGCARAASGTASLMLKITALGVSMIMMESSNRTGTLHTRAFSLSECKIFFAVSD